MDERVVAAALVAAALAICERGGDELELAAMLLRDAANVLDEDTEDCGGNGCGADTATTLDPHA
ncbi:MAG: hypothetical protein ACRDZ4_10135 [Egibacteraceae bacterium]